jgi:hypothetical protein
MHSFRPCSAALPQLLLSVAPFPRDVRFGHPLCLRIDSLTFCAAFASVQSDIFKPTKYGGKYTVTLIPGMTSTYSALVMLALRLFLANTF